MKKIKKCLKRVKSFLRVKSKKVSKPLKHDSYVEIVAEQKNISYNNAKKLMDEIKKKHNISYSEYALNKLYVYKTKKALNERIERMKEQDVHFINKIVADTGWTFEKAEEAAKKAKNKYGFSYRKYANYGFFSFTDEQIRERLEHWQESEEKYRKIAMEGSGWTKAQVIKHMRRFNILYNIQPSYYVLYKGWELTDEQMDSYARQKLSERLWAKYNDKEAVKVLADKLQFDNMYKDYIKRKFWVNVDTSYKEFLEFIDGIDYIFCKPVASGGGIGTSKYKIDHKNPKKLYNELMAKDRLLIEECVMQNKKVNEFYDKSVNTIRVVVLEKDGKCNIISTGFRFGYNSITDNFSQDGMVADIDPKTGIICTPAVDKKGHVFEKHPVTGKKFVGFKVPMWDKVIKVATDAMEVQEGINYVGWDVAICENKVVLIEGNSIPDLVLVQAPYAPTKQGKKYLFDPYF